MKKMIVLIGLISGLTTFAQDPAKTMEKGAKDAYKMLLQETDKNKDGKISKAEFFAIWKDRKIAEEKYRFWDTNKDGFITEAEYVKAVLDIRKKKKK